MRVPRRTASGFSLTETLVLLAIVAVFGILMVLNFSTHQGRARDARRKADLEKIKIAFEEYYNDHGCYPPPTILNNCGGEELQPYLEKIPCDPDTKQPYVYVPDENNICKGYRLLTSLEDESDPAIMESGCNTSCGCGFGSQYNYGVSSGVPLVSNQCTPVTSPTPIPTPGSGTSPSPTPSSSPSPQPTPSATPTSTPTPTPQTTRYACAPDGICNVYADPVGAGCPITFTNASQCQAACANPANRCIQ